MIKAILFDLYETLITEFAGGAKKAPISIEPLGLAPDTYKKAWHERHQLRMDGTFPDYPSVLRNILDAHGQPIDEKVISDLHRQRVAAKAVPFEDIDERIISVLQKLKEKGIKLALVSNCTPEEITAWGGSVLSRLFDEVVFSYKARCAKPDAKIYYHACRAMDVAPDEALFIGDGGSEELVGAEKAGLKAYQAGWFLAGRPEAVQKAFAKLERPEDVLTLI